MKSTSKVSKPVKVLKDGYGAHWHAVGWLAAIALVLSASTMTLSASAQNRITVTPTVIYRAVTDVKTQLNRIEAKIDRLATQCGPTSESLCEEAAIPNKAVTETTDRVNTITDQQKTAPLAAPQPSSDVTKCRLACEDDFNACAKITPNEKMYESCKAPYESCWSKCGQ
jgi:hypothetical protein